MQHRANRRFVPAAHHLSMTVLRIFCAAPGPDRVAPDWPFGASSFPALAIARTQGVLIASATSAVDFIVCHKRTNVNQNPLSPR